MKLCDTLLRAGILYESDWRGEIGSSFDWGMERWYTAAGAESWQCFQLSLIFIENLSDYEITCDGTAGRLGMPVGSLASGIGLYVRDVTWLSAQKRVEFFEELFPGSGFALLGLLNEALWMTTGAFNPPWAHNELMNNDWLMEQAIEYEEDIRANIKDPEEQEAALAEIKSIDNFLRLLPAEALSERGNPRLLKKAQSHLNRFAGTLNGEQIWAEGILREALGLHDLLVAWRKDGCVDKMALIDDYRTIKPIGLTWNREEWTARIADDFVEGACTEGEENQVCAVSPFCLDVAPRHQASLVNALERLRRMVEVLTVVDRLLVAIDADWKTPEERVRIRV